MSAPVETAPHVRLLPLDGLRGIAILAVMMHHFIPPPDSATGASHFFLKIADTGRWGVDLFFVLSGFLITGILYDAKGSHRPLTNFYMRRTLRIFPLYYAVLAILFIILPFLASQPVTSRLLHLNPSSFSSLFGGLAGQQGWLWGYAANIKLSLEGNWTALGFLNHFWSLAVEEHFYLFWPFLILNCERRSAILWCLALAGVALAGRTYCVIAGTSFVAPYTLTPCRLDSLAIGGLAALLWRNPEGRGDLPGMARKVFFIFLPLAAAALFLWKRDVSQMVIAGPSLLAVLFASLLLWSLGTAPGSWVHRFLCFRGLRLFGTYSYGLYVFHYILRDPLTRLLSLDHNLLMDRLPIAGIALRIVVLTTISLSVALVSWNFFEKQCLRLKRFFQDSRAPKAAPQPVFLGTFDPQQITQA